MEIGWFRHMLRCAMALSLASMVALVPYQAEASRAPKARSAPPAVLVYTNAVGFVHKSIPVGAEAIRRLGAQNGFAVDVTGDPAKFQRPNLARYRALVFLSTTGDVLPAQSQRAALEGYIRSGGGFFGIHAASDMGKVATDWPFYRNLVGAAFKGHTNARLYADTQIPSRPSVTYGGPLSAAPADADFVAPGMKASSSEPATVMVEDRRSPMMRGWGASANITDEWYGFLANPRPNVHVVASLDEKTYTPGAGAMDGNHPIAWCHAFGGGRSVYTALGHPLSSWGNPQFLQHILGGIKLAMGTVPFRC